MPKKKIVKKIAKKIVRKVKKILRPKAVKKTAIKARVRKPRALTPGLRGKAGVPPSVGKEILGAQEVKIEKAKFSASETVSVARRPAQMQELPHAYGENKIVLLVRDCSWLYTYWEVRSDTIDKIKREIGDAFSSAKRVLRVYDITDITFNGTNAHRFFDIDVGHDKGDWYINSDPGRSWCVDFGLLLSDGRFITIVRSNTVTTPIEGPSRVTDEEWMIPEEIFARLYGMGFGFGKTSPGKGWQERIRRELFSGILASPGMASMASPVKKALKERKFWLVVNTELIVYGATEPDAKVTVQGKPVRLRQDGTFTLRFSLPDGKQFIPVCAVSSDEVETRTITPIVAKETK